ncbi:MAG: TIGR00282 family metallophosphoesterase [Candidatus Sumerlaeota bacterium]
MLRILFIGDIVGRPGRKLVKELLPDLRRERDIDFVIANGENAAGGRGLTPAVAKELFKAGCDVLTGGNHTWGNRDIFKIIDEEPRILRPENYPAHADIPGNGWDIYTIASSGHLIGVVNLLGRVFMDPLECPFRAAKRAVNEIRRTTPIVIVDFHAEATSEKIAMGWHLDGLASVVLGTHTHVPTADENITEEGTATQTDVGMTGSFNGVLGVKKEVILHRMLTQMPVRHELSTGDLRFCGLLVEVEAQTGKAQSVERLMIRHESQ